MDLNRIARARVAGGLIAIAVHGVALAQADHLLISEVVLAGAGEYIEIVNPTAATVDLGKYYLADSTSYWRVSGNPFQPPLSDFIAKFPDGTVMAPGQVITVSTTTVQNGFFNTYGIEASSGMAPTTSSTTSISCAPALPPPPTTSSARPASPATGLILMLTLRPICPTR
jgi:hypothetical protein